jgi:hypothetical protein
MMENDSPAEKPASRNITAAEGIITAATVAYCLLLIIVAEFYSGWYAALMGLSLLLALLCGVRRMPDEQKAAVYAALRRRDQTTLGRLGKLIEYVAFAAALWVLARWLFGPE